MPVIERKGLAWDCQSRDGWRGNSAEISRSRVLLAAGADSLSSSPGSSSGAATSTPSETAQPASQSQRPKGKRRVLVVEDDESSRNALQFLLASSGWEVDLANNLAEALDLLKKSPPDSVVLDLMLPDGDGTLLLEYLRDK